MLRNGQPSDTGVVTAVASSSISRLDGFVRRMVFRSRGCDPREVLGVPNVEVLSAEDRHYFACARVCPGR